LWAFFARGSILIYETQFDEVERLRTLMRKYHDTPMDLADASLVSAAERLGAKRVFTHDQHFFAYRAASGHLELFN